MAVDPNKTLGEVRYDIAVRLGYGAQGTVNKNQIPILNNFINDAQRQLFRKGIDSLLRFRVDDSKSFIVGQTIYDIPDDADPLRVQSVHFQLNDHYYPLEYGVDIKRHIDNDARPYFWEIRQGTTGQPQIEVWPRPTEDSGMRLQYMPKVKDLSNASDRLLIDDHAVFLLALANAKAHYRQPDAAAVSNELDQYLNDLRYAQHAQRKYRLGREDFYDYDGVHLFEEG